MFGIALAGKRRAMDQEYIYHDLLGSSSFLSIISKVAMAVELPKTAASATPAKTERIIKKCDPERAIFHF
jgi:hypothetical protein